MLEDGKHEPKGWFHNGNVQVSFALKVVAS